jgi:hypothetical protein
MFRTTALTAALMVLSLAGPASADIIALDFTGGTVTAISPVPTTIGWSFTANSNVTVTQLGFFDNTPATPLSTSHAVGIWTNVGLLLGSSVVQTNSPITNGFRYVPTIPFQLNAGQNYVIGALVLDPPDNDNAFISGVPGSSPLSTTTAPEISYGGSRSGIVSSNLMIPENLFPVDFFGPNFQFSVTPVPAPPAILLVGLGAGCVALRRYVQRRVSA